MDAAKPLIVSCLEEIFTPLGIVARNDVAVRAKEALPLETAVLAGTIPEAVAVEMNGLKLSADLLHGQKTGIYLDQRENYRAVARYATGGKALDCFTSTGGFALHLAAHCESVEAVDSSEAALKTARANAEDNGIANIEFRQAAHLPTDSPEEAIKNAIEIKLFWKGNVLFHPVQNGVLGHLSHLKPESMHLANGTNFEVSGSWAETPVAPSPSGRRRRPDPELPAYWDT